MTSVLVLIKTTNQEIVGLRRFSFPFSQTNFAVTSFVKERPYGLACHSLAVILEVMGEETALPRHITEVASREGKGAKNAINPVQGYNASLYNKRITKSISHIYPKLVLIIHSRFMVSLLEKSDFYKLDELQTQMVSFSCN